MEVLEGGHAVGLLHDHAAVHHHHVVGNVSDHAEVVRDQDHSSAELLLQPVDHLQHLRLDRHVQRGRGLVSDEQRRAQGHRHGDHGPLAHAAGELVRVVIDPPVGLRDAHQSQQLDRPLLRGLLRDLLVVQPDHLDDLPADLVERVQARQRILEDHADLGAPDAGHLGLTHREQVTALEQRLALDLGAAGQAHDRLGCYALA